MMLQLKWITIAVCSAGIALSFDFARAIVGLSALWALPYMLVGGMAWVLGQDRRRSWIVLFVAVTILALGLASFRWAKADPKSDAPAFWLLVGLPAMQVGVFLLGMFAAARRSRDSFKQETANGERLGEQMVWPADRKRLLERLSEQFQVSTERIETTESWRQFSGSGDSLDVVELVIGLESELNSGTNN